MNKYIAWLPALMILGTIIYQPVKKVNEAKTVNKSISFAVHKGSKYASGIYDNTSAQVHIIVEKVTNKGERIIVWEKIMDAKQLKQYPTATQALSEQIVVSNLNEKKEHLEVRYVLTYNSKGSELQMHDGIVVSEKSSMVDISI